MDKKMYQRKPVFPQVKGFVHGGDYNPDQWLDRPDILEEDVRLMKKAGVNCVTLGVFAWAAYEPVEGEYHFDWLEKIIDNLYENGIYTILSTPSGARPAWMAEKYEEVLRVDDKGMRARFGARHNHCPSSPVYREKVKKIDQLLAEKFANNPAVIMWHISNELGGTCYCPICTKRFQNYLAEKFDSDIEKLNKTWWNSFWSHNYSSFEQIDPPMQIGEMTNIELLLEWKRFSTWNMTDYMKSEIEVLKAANPDIPVTTNFMELFGDYDYREMAKELDVISWDCYPFFGNDWESLHKTLIDSAFDHAVLRSLKPDQPFMMMESAPGLVNWHPVNKLKRPGVHRLACLQAVATGSDTVQYFQWRKGRGGFEQHHGAVVDHVGTDDTRVFKEVAEVGDILQQIQDVTGSVVNAKVAIMFDWDNRWSIWEVKALANESKKFEETVQGIYTTLLKMGIDADMIGQQDDFSRYDVIIAPMMYLVHEGTGAKMKAFVENGGQLVGTYFTGYVNEHQLCYLGGFPGDGLAEVFGVISEEIDTYYPKDRNSVIFDEGAFAGSKGFTAEVFDYAEILRVQDAKVLATYGSDFYQGQAAVTCKENGKGKAYYIAARMNPEDMRPLFAQILAEAGVAMKEIPDGVEFHERECVNEDGSEVRYQFYLNETLEEKTIEGVNGRSLRSGAIVDGSILVKPYDVEVIEVK